MPGTAPRSPLLAPVRAPPLLRNRRPGQRSLPGIPVGRRVARTFSSRPSRCPLEAREAGAAERRRGGRGAGRVEERPGGSGGVGHLPTAQWLPRG